MVDIHSHILPGVDDGAADMEISLEMCRIAVADGVSTLAATPHMRDGVYNVERDTIINGVHELRKRLKEEGIPLNVVPGADIHVDVDFVKLLEKGCLVTLNDTGKFVLIEFPPYSIPPQSAEFLFSLQITGVVPIITHPERNQAVQRNPEMVNKWVETGNLIQVTAGSITGALGKEAQTSAMKLLSAGLVHIVASDAHSATWRPPGLSSAKKVVAETLSEEEADMVCNVRPERIIEGKPVDIPDPEMIRPAKERSWFSCFRDRLKT